MRSNARAHSWKAKVCFAMGKHASQWMEQTEANLSYNLLVTLHFLWELLLRTICHRRCSDRGCDDSRFWYSRSHVSVAHLFFRSISISCTLTTASTGQQCILLVLFQIYGTSSSPVRTVKDGSEPLAIHTFPLTNITELAFVCLTHDRRLKFRDVISALRYLSHFAGCHSTYNPL